MRSILTVLCLFTLTSSLYSQPMVPGPPTVPMILQVAQQQKPFIRVSPNPPSVSVSTYDQAATKAAREGKLLVVFVGVPAREIKGVITHDHWEAQPPYPLDSIVVSKPSFKHATYNTILSSSANDLEILTEGARLSPLPFGTSKQSIQPERPRGIIRPFLKRLFNKAQQLDNADADLLAVSSWLEYEQLSWLDYMEEYPSARLIQVSGNRSGRGANWAVSRSSIDLKWSVPGGLDKIHGWSNILLRSPNNRVTNYMERANPGEVFPGTGGWGSEFIYKRSYADGAKFSDVLINSSSGEVFEVRVQEKKNGLWNRFVAWRNRAAQPIGYKTVSITQCAECHSQAGSGDYGGPRIPGGDSILSEKLAGVE